MQKIIRVKFLSAILLLMVQAMPCFAEDGYRLWLRYDKISNNNGLLQQYRQQTSVVRIYGNSPIITAAKNELTLGLDGMLGSNPAGSGSNATGILLVGTREQLPDPAVANGVNYTALGRDGFIIKTLQLQQKKLTLITANTDIGLLYGSFEFLRLLQTRQDTRTISIISIPKIQNRILNHWDNLNRTVERGYAGFSIWNWHTLPDYIDQRYIDYARANASIGINGTVLTNVNANALLLTPAYLLKVKALADVFRAYGLKVFLTAKFSAPVEIGGLKTADPLDSSVIRWWKNKIAEMYTYIPDFGGFLVKANSEGQPGPQTYGRNHADGANMLADAIAPYKGIIMWRAFVYDVRVQKRNENFDTAGAARPMSDIAAADRFKQAFSEFTPFDGSFRKNVVIQVKNGPIDFQPREPFSPLFGALRRTPVAMEFQLTMEYLGQGTHLVYQAPLFKEVLDARNYANNTASTVAGIIDGTQFNTDPTVMSGVSNIGNDRNWTGNPFGQATWYAYGRLAWNHQREAMPIAAEWVSQTFSINGAANAAIVQMMMASREAVVNYMTPLGLHHIMAATGHYGPGPWLNNLGRADWNPVYYHRADSFGIGFDRTATGSNALAQYAPELQRLWGDPATCDEKYLLWFHHVSWAHRMKSGKTLWDELCSKYQEGVDSVRRMQQQWKNIAPLVDAERHRQVTMFLQIQEKDAVWWRNACLLYFQTFSKMPLPANVEKPDQTLDYYKNLRIYYVPGSSGN